jgi:aminoglycoside phosphotransferase (APT) family kinase protein
VIGNAFFVMDFVEGAEDADERAVGEETAASFVQHLHRLHLLDGSAFGFDIVPDHPSHATPLQIERWRIACRSASPVPIPLLEEAAAWLLHRAPTTEHLAVVHGDAGPGNFVHAGGRVVAVTDWEFAHLGDPAEDWAFCLTMRGSRTMPRADWLRLFEEHAGFTMDDEGWRYWEAFNLFKGACANRTCLHLFEDGRNRAANMAIIGTALHQVFLRRLVEIVHG